MLTQGVRLVVFVSYCDGVSKYLKFSTFRRSIYLEGHHLFNILRLKPMFLVCQTSYVVYSVLSQHI